MTPTPHAHLAARLEALAAENARMREALEWIDRHYANQDISHVDFRVEVYSRARAAIAAVGVGKFVPAESEGAVVERAQVWPLIHTLLVQFAPRIAEAEAATTHDERVAIINGVSAHIAKHLEDLLDARAAVMGAP